MYLCLETYQTFTNCMFIKCTLFGICLCRLVTENYGISLNFTWSNFYFGNFNTYRVGFPNFECFCDFWKIKTEFKNRRMQFWAKYKTSPEISVNIKNFYSFLWKMWLSIELYFLLTKIYNKIAKLWLKIKLNILGIFFQIFFFFYNIFQTGF